MAMKSEQEVSVWLVCLVGGYMLMLCVMQTGLTCLGSGSVETPASINQCAFVCHLKFSISTVLFPVDSCSNYNTNVKQVCLSFHTLCLCVLDLYQGCGLICQEVFILKTSDFVLGFGSPDMVQAYRNQSGPLCTQTHFQIFTVIKKGLRLLNRP